MEFHLLKIAESSESIRTLDFRKPSIFTNAMLMNPEITSLIHDADLQEQALFASEYNGPHRTKISVSAGLNSDEEEWNVEVLCVAIEKLAAIYPMVGIDYRVSEYRRKWTAFNESIMKCEDIVEEQRQQLAQLNISLENREFKMDGEQRFEGNDLNRVDQLIRDTEEEIWRLEKEFEENQKEVSKLLITKEIKKIII